MEFWTLVLVLMEKENREKGKRKSYPQEVSTDGVHMERNAKFENDRQISSVLTWLF